MNAVKIGAGLLHYFTLEELEAAYQLTHVLQNVTYTEARSSSKKASLMGVHGQE